MTRVEGRRGDFFVQFLHFRDEVVVFGFREGVGAALHFQGGSPRNAIALDPKKLLR